MSRLQSAVDRVKLAIGRQFSSEAFSALVHVFLLFVFVTIVRPLFSASIAAQDYEARSIVVSALQTDYTAFIRAATRNTAAVPEVMYLFIPTLFFLFTKRKLRWTDWQHGLAFRALVMTILAVVVWSGTTFEYNNYLHRGHVFDRLLLLGLFGLSWRFPLAVPFAVRLGIIMVREGYVPINLDDFEFRTVTELLTIFSVFIWMSARRSFQPWHVLIVGFGSWACYYYIAGMAKWTFGPKYSWLLENRLTNFAMSAHMRGWLTWVSEERFNAIVRLIRPYDVLMSVYTLIVEFGALVAFFLHRKTARLWFGLCFLLHTGIYAMTGVFFWKWMLVNAAFIWWLGRKDARPILEKFYAYKFPLILATAAVFFSANRVWYWPQTHVVWYDTQLLDQYDIVAVGKSGERYFVDPNYFAPQDLHIVQGAFCYATDNERAVTHIYGTTGSYEVMKQLNQFTDPKQALALHNRGGVCSNAPQRLVWDNYMKRFFGNINQYGRPYDWVTRFGCPHHLWIDVRGKEFHEQEKVTHIELWRTLMYAHGGKYHTLEKKLAHKIEVPNAQ